MSSQVISFNDINIDYDPSNNISVKFLTIYEKTSILGLRKQQLVNGANHYLTDEEIKNYDGNEENILEQIAETELKLKKLPFMICRTFANGLKEYYKLDDLIIL